MPFRISAPSARPAGPARRTVLARAAAAGAPLVALLAGCTPGSRPARAGRAADRDTAARRRAAADSTALLGRYDAVLAAHPPLAGRLAPLRAQVAAHAAAFGAAVPSSAAPSRPGSPSASASAPPSPAASASPKDALRSLADAERDTAARRTAALADASPALARLLASVAACGAGHVALLTGAGR